MSVRTHAVIGLALAAAACHAPADGPARGEAVYATCRPCHGDHAEGKRETEAPPIAGLPLWYVEAQLLKFRDGARGDHPQDVAGLKMRPMARALSSDTDLKSVAAYVAGLSPHRPTASLSGGDAGRGAALFATCAACHGADGSGNEALKAPPLRQEADWYMQAQLQKFRSGVRGADKADITGAQMAPMARTLTDDQAVKDVVAHIATLAR